MPALRRATNFPKYFTCPDGAHVTLGHERLELSASEIGGRLRHHGWILNVDPSSALTWPVYPHSPHANAPEKSLERAVGVVTGPLRLAVALYDTRRGIFLGNTKAYQFSLDQMQPTLLTVLDEPVTGLIIDAPKTAQGGDPRFRHLRLRPTAAPWIFASLLLRAFAIGFCGKPSNSGHSSSRRSIRGLLKPRVK
jgi:hypothetical protein